MDLSVLFRSRAKPQQKIENLKEQVEEGWAVRDMFTPAKEGFVAFQLGGKTLCNLIEFDYKALPPQVAVAIRMAYLEGLEDATKAHEKEEEERAYVVST